MEKNITNGKQHLITSMSFTNNDLFELTRYIDKNNFKGKKITPNRF